MNCVHLLLHYFQCEVMFAGPAGKPGDRGGFPPGPVTQRLAPSQTVPLTEQRYPKGKAFGLGPLPYKRVSCARPETQNCGSGSNGSASVWEAEFRIRSKKQDPELHRSQKLDTDPH